MYRGPATLYFQTNAASIPAPCGAYSSESTAAAGSLTRLFLRLLTG